MFGYGNSGNILGIIIGVVIGAIIIFLICRELVCWYWKINRLVVLMEQQNILLKEILDKNKMVPEVITDSLTGDKYTVQTETAIRSSPDFGSTIKKPLKIGDTVFFQNTLDKDPNWFYVDTIDSIKGWCFAPHFEKI